MTQTNIHTNMYISITRMNTHFSSSSFIAIRFYNTKNSRHSRTAHPLLLTPLVFSSSYMPFKMWCLEIHRLGVPFNYWSRLMMKYLSCVGLQEPFQPGRWLFQDFGGQTWKCDRCFEGWEEGGGMGKGGITTTEDSENVLQLEMCNADTQPQVILPKY